VRIDPVPRDHSPGRKRLAFCVRISLAFDSYAMCVNCGPMGNALVGRLCLQRRGGGVELYGQGRRNTLTDEANWHVASRVLEGMSRRKARAVYPGRNNARTAQVLLLDGWICPDSLAAEKNGRRGSARCETVRQRCGGGCVTWAQ